ncbi:MAG: hypothetical protein AAF387_19475 [Pseudomonadota bacterium]
MSTVLWANYLEDGKVVSDESDKYAIYKHAKKLDAIAKKLALSSFIDMQDTTDYEFNVTDKALPPGMESTDELMARDGIWVEAQSAIDLLNRLIEEIEAKKIRFGILSDARSDVVAELKDSLTFAQKAQSRAAKFNFSVVM